MKIKIIQLCAAAVLTGLAGCASIDYDYPRSESFHATDTADTGMGRLVEPVVATRPAGQSGFYPVVDGVEALSIRLLLADRAERSIDLQYYLIKNDVVGRALIEHLLRAADRGVRVRLLLDDMFTAGHDVGIAALDSHPNVEIRIFNPFRRGAVGRSLGAMTEFGRINRRMHNKSFTIDNQITVIGGRNIADEYFGVREDAKFGDLDVLAIGPVVDDVSAMFDSYWNHPTALPTPAFLEPLDDPEAALAEVRRRMDEAQREIKTSRYAAAVKDKMFRFIQGDRHLFNWAPYRLVVDSPDKGMRDRAKDAELITAPLAEAMKSAQDRLVIVSAYFVPLKGGVEFLAGLAQRGVEVTVVTNSLAANNQFTVHGGYAPARKPLLEAGVKLFEVRPDADIKGTEFIDATGAKATLHTKAFFVDREQVFIGSFNMDPRSARINTELGVMIEDPVLAAAFADFIDAGLQGQSYEVYLNERGQLRWRTVEDGREVIYDKEPQTTWSQRFMAGLARIIPAGQL